MRPTPFTVEIPDRPVYVPGSGPAVAPITLQPDNHDTGWVIAGTVDFQGLSQYVVTPKDNPAHRRPVKKQHILDWVSPKAHEDFEYAQYKIQTEAERQREKESHILAKAAAIRQKRHGMGLTRGRPKARKSFARYMQLERVEEIDKGDTNGHLSSPEHSPDESSGEVLSGRVEPNKRKLSAGFPHTKEPAVKRRALSGSSKASLAWKAWKPTPFNPGQQQQIETTGDEADGEDEADSIPKSVNKGLKRLNTFDRAILPPQKRISSPVRTSVPSRPFLSPHSTHTNWAPAVGSPSRASPKLPWSVVDHATHVPQSASPPGPSKATSPRKFTPVQPPNHGKVFPPILPPTALWKPPVSNPISKLFHTTLNGGEESRRRGVQERQHHSLSPKDESSAADETSGAKHKSTGFGSDPAYDKKIMGRSHFSDLALTRDTRASNELKVPKQSKGKGSRSSSSASSNVLRWPRKPENTDVSNERSKYFASMKMKHSEKEDVRNNEEDGESEEAWDIHGILDDEVRRVNGQLVRHYLCDWVGDYDPTWEPEENVSTDAIKRYEEKNRRNGLGLDGAADVDITSQNGKASDWKTLGGLGNSLRDENETSDSEYFSDALTEVVTFLTPDENPHSHSSAGSATGKGVVVDAELL